MTSKAGSDYDHLIPPEIKNDPFYTAILELSRRARIRTVLEIGSSSGEGSTEAFVRGLRENPNKPTLYCMEVSRPRFEALRERYKAERFVRPYNVSSVPLSKFPSEDEVTRFYQRYLAGRFVPLPEFLRWLRQDLEYVRSSRTPEDGIGLIKRENNIDRFDLVLIDGSEFTGKAELDQVYGARYILLDDVNTFKNFENFQRLAADPNYLLREVNRQVRGGYAVFEQVYRDRPASIPHEPAERSLVATRVREGMTVFDVGANVGDYSILFSRLVGETGKVFAFEPASATAEKLTRRLAAHDCANARVFRNAAYSRNTRLEFNEFPDEFSVWNSIGKPKMAYPDDPSRLVPLERTETVGAVRLDDFCERHGVRVIHFMKLDVEGAESEALLGAESLLARRALRFIQFEISQAMLQGMNKSAREVFDILERHGYECRRIQPDGSLGPVVSDSREFYANYAAFPKLCVHFFTIVLNGEPYIRHHVEQMKKLPFDWRWHVVEGVAKLVGDTAWSVPHGGRVPEQAHRDGSSTDGTSEYLDHLSQQMPDRVVVYRKPPGEFWNGKLEMVNKPLESIAEDCLLWEIDADELWTAEQFEAGRKLFLDDPSKTAAMYWCWMFVGPDLVTSTRHCYANNPQMEWIRTWRYRPGMRWAAHEPPILAEPTADGQWRSVVSVNPILHDQTEAAGLVFQHYAYATEKQVRFKQDYYGYAGAVGRWRALQAMREFPVPLRHYFPWVGDDTQADRAGDYVAKKLVELPPPELAEYRPARGEAPRPRVVIDGVFYQMFNTGIARVWTSLLEWWAKDGFARSILVLDRVGTAPKVEGVRYRVVPPYDYNNAAADREMLQRVCDEEGADVFASTYYTTPLATPQLFMIHDMIPELFGWDLRHPMWREKHEGVRRAAGFVAVSESTRRDFLKFFPNVGADKVLVTPLAASPVFSPMPDADVRAFRETFGVRRPYFLIVGARGGYKNTILSFRGLSKLRDLREIEVVCTGGGPLEPEFAPLVPTDNIKVISRTSDEELAAAYSGAAALLHPSTYEGFGLPVLEAMACGCPVITTKNGSLAEVAGDAALFVSDDDADAMARAVDEVRRDDVRHRLVDAGLKQAAKFSWAGTARQVRDALESVAATNKVSH